MSKKEVGGFLASPIERRSTSKGPEPPTYFFDNLAFMIQKSSYTKTILKPSKTKEAEKM